MEAATKKAFRFVVLVGVVSLFADATYEGARSVTGPYLGILGATGAVVGTVAGLGELIGYVLRLLTGYIADRTRRYWGLTIAGYVINMAAVPLLAFASHWELAAGLIVAERVGKSIRTPARDAMLSHAASRVGRGWAFGLHEALDQVGAFLGPIIIATVLYLKGSYQSAFLCLGIPAILCVAFLIAARVIYPTPSEFEESKSRLPSEKFPRVYWIYLCATALIAAGYADFPLIAFHFKKTNLAGDPLIPIFYSIAMGVDAGAALFFGKMFDRKGLSVLLISTVLSALFAPFVFSGSIALAILGVTLWGIGMGAQESIVRAAISGMISTERRGTAYGLFNAVFGISWFAGSALMGFLYDYSLRTLILYSVVVQLISLIFLWFVRTSANRDS